MKAGESDAQVTTYIVERYGEYVLLKPPFAWHTLLLWLLPVLVLARRRVGGCAGMRAKRCSAGRARRALSREEEAKLKDILAGSEP